MNTIEFYEKLVTLTETSLCGNCPLKENDKLCLKAKNCFASKQSLAGDFLCTLARAKLVHFNVFKDALFSHHTNPQMEASAEICNYLEIFEKKLLAVIWASNEQVSKENKNLCIVELGHTLMNFDLLDVFVKNHMLTFELEFEEALKEFCPEKH